MTSVKINIKKEKKKNLYGVESSRVKGRFYTVDIAKPWCSCPDFMFRESKLHSTCKHIKAVQKMLGIKKEKMNKKITKKRNKKIKKCLNDF